MDFVEENKYPLLIGIDSNAHSTLYGHETNKRGEDFEDFIFKYQLDIANKAGEYTFEARRGGIQIKMCIDVKLFRDLEDKITNWRTENAFNGSDHKTITFNLLCEEPEIEKFRNYRKANWNRFKQILQEYSYFYPHRINKKKTG